MNNTITDHDVFIPRFKFFVRQMNGHKGDVVCFYPHSHLNCKVCEELMIDRLECSSVEINKGPHSLPFLVITWYSLHILLLTCVINDFDD